MFEGRWFLDTMSETFRRFSVTDLQVSDIQIEGSSPPSAVTFQQLLTLVDPEKLEQRTEASLTRMQLSWRVGVSGTVTLLLAGVAREGPRFRGPHGARWWLGCRRGWR